MKYKRLRKMIDAGARRSASFRVSLMFGFFSIAMLAVAFGMVRLQFGRSAEFRAQAESNTFCSIPLPAVRGDITDRNGAVIAADNSDFRVVKTGRNCSWEEIEYLNAAAGAAHSPISPLEKISPEDAEKFWRGRFNRISALAEMPEEQPDRFVDIVPRRVYPAGEYASHIAGYMGKISPEEIKRFSASGYKDNDRIGKSGLERWYETYINGTRGAREILTDAPGRILSRKRIVYAKKGKPLRLSLDLELQKAAVNAFKRQKKTGAAIFMDTRNGEILAMVSAPGFSPAPGPDGLTPAGWTDLARDPSKPLLNRAVSSSLPLGSVFKLVAAAAALEEKLASKNSVFNCRGYYPLPGRESYPPRCYTTHGPINFINGIAQSCDVVFYTLGQKLGVTKIARYAKLFGLGSKTGIDIPGESVGLVPDEYWKKHFGGGGKWTAGDTINLSIGQGNMQVTPAQVARMVNVFASDGNLVTPHFAREGNWTPVKLPISKQTLAVVRAGMRGAVLNGTCRGMMQFPVPSAAKTGTAQTGTMANPLKSHSWFAGFVPYGTPVITFAVYVEHGGYGAEAALPIAREILAKALDLGYFPGYSDTGGN